jgi:hypothetical protein
MKLLKWMELSFKGSFTLTGFLLETWKKENVNITSFLKVSFIENKVLIKYWMLENLYLKC